MATLHCSKHGLNVACISKVPPTRSHTVAAKGGINAALGNIEEDRWQWHMYDTIRGSDWLADQDAVELLCSHAKEAILELESFGIPFSRNAEGKIDQRIYGGQSTHFGQGNHAHRACYVADRTGHAILHTLYQQCIRNKTTFLIDYAVIDLLFEANRCIGLLALEIDTGELHVFQAKAVVMATGGHGQIYGNTTSSNICTGDGTAMVARHGLPLKDMEFVQFHPTGLYNNGLLITEAARAEGAWLLNGQGERFMERYAPKYKELAARDVVARAISQEISEGRGAGENKDHILLDLRHLSKETLQKKLPEVCELARNFAKTDPHSDAIPILPSVHYMMGGIPTNLHCEVLDQHNNTVPGLFAIGENACLSVHGANRLGCNALLDLIVFAKVAGNHIYNVLQEASSLPTPKPSKEALQVASKRIDNLLSGKGQYSTSKLKTEMQAVMDKHFGVYRTEETMKEGLDTLKALYEKRHNITVTNTSLIWNTELIDALEFQNMITLAYATASAALYRKESRGSHYRADYPERDDQHWLSHSFTSIENDKVTCKKHAVRIQKSTAEHPAFKPEPRKY